MIKIKITKKTELKEILSLSHPCKCDSCAIGCKHGSGAFDDNEIPKLAGHLKISEDVLKKEFLEEIEKFNTKKFRPRILRKEKQYGKCIFFDEELKCKIHEVKPLECKIAMGCKDYGEQLSLWFMHNLFVNKDNPQSIRDYASYLKSGGKKLEGTALEELVPDKEKLKKILSFELLK